MNGGDMVIVIDTREQLELSFSPAVKVLRRALPSGDYSLEGYETEIAVERKSLDDLCGSLTQGRERFTRELERLADYRLAVILIEASWQDVLSGAYRSRVTSQSIIGSLMSFYVRYGVQTLMAGNHRTAGVLCERLLRNYYRIALERREVSQVQSQGVLRENASTGTDGGLLCESEAIQ